MGCAGSKLDDLQVVALCRERCQLLDDAIRLRYALADAHVHYCHALRSMGVSIERLVNANFDAQPSSPVLNLPPSRKGDPETSPLPEPALIPPVPTASTPAQLSHSNSGSHIHFHSDSDDDGSHLCSEESSPLHEGQPKLHFNYMRSQPPPPSVSYEQHPGRHQRVQFFKPLYTSPPYVYPYQNPDIYSSSYPYPAGSSSFFASPPAYTCRPSSSSPPLPAGRVDDASTSREIPTPPSPPGASPWDFLNPFDVYDGFYPAPYTPSRSSREVREEEGIPDLEDEDSQNEVVKEVQAERKFVDPPGPAYTEEAPAEEAHDIHRGGDGGGGGELEHEVNVVDKKVVQNDQSCESKGDVSAFHASRAVPDAVREVRDQFERAAEAADKVSTMLEAGKHLYHRKSAFKAPAKMWSAITPSLSQPLPADVDNTLLLNFGDDVAMKAGNLSCTLEKLQMWEKKLYDEVKAEEKVRILLERKCRRLKHLDEKGAEAFKVDATRRMIRKLSTKIRVSLQVMDSISHKISKLRDEELWPQIRELIQGLIAMWRILLECHRCQWESLSESQNFDAMDGKLGDSHVEVIMQLERNLLNWTSSFCTWICTQKGYIRALNSWLLKCLPKEHEETLDGPAPFSPSRLGAPLLFVICNQWAHALDRVSESEIFEAVQAFSGSVLQLWERHNMIRRQKLLASKDVDRQMRVLEREEQSMQKEFEMHNKKLILVSEFTGAPIPGQILYHACTGDLQAGLKQLFEALMKFSAESLELYEGLNARCEENGFQN